MKNRRFRRRRRLLSACTVLTLNSVGIGVGATPPPQVTPPAQTGTLPTSLAQRPDSVPSRTPSLGVVRSADNTAQWLNIEARLTRAGTPYRVVPLEQLRDAQTLSAALGTHGVLFLPNQTVLSSEQVASLRRWLTGGGRLIVSGPLGSRSEPAVRRELQALGAYWSSDLSRATDFSLIREARRSWARGTDSDKDLQGGILIPSSVDSQTVASWDYPGRPPAVVVTPQVTFLGWRWGEDRAAPVGFDADWLRAALNRFETSTVARSSAAPAPAAPPVSPRPVQPETSPTAAPSRIQLSPRAATPPPSVAQRPSTPRMERRTPSLSELQTSRSAPSSVSTFRPQRRTPTLAELQAVRSGASSATARSLPTGPNASLTAPRVQSTGEDTDVLDAVGPAPLPLPPATPINALEAIALRQELTDLLGRVESALLTRYASAPSTQTAALPEYQTLQQAQKFLQEFPKLVGSSDPAEVRSRWAAARDSLRAIYPTEQLNTMPEVRAIWLDRGTIVQAGSEAGLARVFDRLAAAGVNTIFFETVNAGYPVYPSQVAPEQNPLIRGWDPLAAAVRLAHERKMELHAWVWVFAVGNDRHNALLGLPGNYPGPVIARNPGWANYDNRGSMVPPGQGKPFLDPANPEARAYLHRLFREIVTNYQVDGLQLDYIRYPFQDASAQRTYGYGRAAREQFQQIAGVDPLTISPGDRSLWWMWTEFRTAQVNQFVADTARSLRSLRPGLVLSAAVFPLSEYDRTQDLQQHWETWARNGDIDLLIPMTYALSTSRWQALVQPSLAQASQAPVLFLPSVKLLGLPDNEFLDQLQTTRDLPTGGYSLFAAAHLRDSLQRILAPLGTNAQRANGTTADKANADNGRILPYRQPFAAAEVRFQVLRREWEYLSSQNLLWLRDEDRRTWQAQAETLGAALTALVRTPSRAHLDTARAALTRMQSGLNSWMRLEALERPYRLRTWQNRLTAMGAMLRYGERVTLGQSSGAAASSPVDAFTSRVQPPIRP